ncbi:MAG: tetratricopeptide repeat protein [Planctomycetia bacterium]|nr:tetratricopeptide repeat protein [Planctomycetia bacterium]
MNLLNIDCVFIKKITILILVLIINCLGCESFNNSAVRNSEGVGYYTQGQYDQAIAVFQEAIEIDPNNADAYYNLASTYQQQAGQLQQSALAVQAENYYRLCLEKNPSSETTICCYRGLATIMNQRNQGDQALELLRQWEARNINSAEPKLEIAYLLEAQGKYSEAVDELKKVVTLVPQDYRPYYKLGVLYEKLGNSDAALNNYLMASRLNPSDTGIARNVSVLQSQIANGSFPKAIVAAQKETINQTTIEGNLTNTDNNFVAVGQNKQGMSSLTNNLLPSVNNPEKMGNESIANAQPEISFANPDSSNLASNRTSNDKDQLLWMENARSVSPNGPADSLSTSNEPEPSYASPLANSSPVVLPQNDNSTGQPKLNIPDGTGSSTGESSLQNKIDQPNPVSSSSTNNNLEKNDLSNHSSPSYVADNINPSSSSTNHSSESVTPSRRNRIGNIGGGPPRINVGVPF